MASGELSATAIIRMYLDRIARIDDNGPELHAVIELNPDAMAIAAERDRERAEGRVRGPLHGIPILIKDNIDTGDKMETTAGSLAMAGHRADRDAFVVARLREAGAIILGKANMTEWANFRSPYAISGWSSRGGQTKNPYVLTASPCGSSSGSATAVAAELCAIAVGTSTNGSIACPSSFNGVVGVRPTMGLVSRTGIIPLAFSQDAAGPIARTVRDAAILLDAMAGRDPADASTASAPAYTAGRIMSVLDTTTLRGKRIGIDRQIIGEMNGLGVLFQQVIAQLKAGGATIVEVDFIDAYNGLRQDEFVLMAHEFKAGINRYLASANGRVRSLEDLIRYNEAHAETIMSYFGQEYLDSAFAAGTLEDRTYLDAKARLAGMRKHLESLFTRERLDAIAGMGYGAYSPSAVSGFPSVTVPAGMFNGLPAGVTFIGKAFREDELLGVAYAFEQRMQARTPPTFLPGNVVP